MVQMNISEKSMQYKGPFHLASLQFASGLTPVKFQSNIRKL